MFGLTILQEAALAMVWLRQDELAANMTSAGLTKELLALRDAGMIQMQTDMSGELALVQNLYADGRDHYDKVRSARRRFKSVSDEADELAGLIYGEARKQLKTGAVNLTYHDGRINEYRELDRQGLIEVFWADDAPYAVNVTDEGWSYIEGWFLDQEASLELNINPVFNNNNYAQQTALATATANNNSLGMTLSLINELDLDQDLKDEVVAALKNLENASKKKDERIFMEKLEKVASIAKSASALTSAVLPYIGDLISKFGL